MMSESSEKILHQLVVIFLNKKSNSYGEYRNKTLIFKQHNTFSEDEFNSLHIYVKREGYTTPFIKLVKFTTNRWFSQYTEDEIYEFIKLVISENELDNIIIEFEKELLSIY